MPARDGTGPMGQGSQTGRGLGNCGTSGDETSRTRNINPTPGATFRRGAGMWSATFGRLFGRRRNSRMNRR